MPHHRARLEAILLATDVFRGEEIAVALELFDEAVTPRPRATRPLAPDSHETPAGRDLHGDSTASPPPASSDYVFLGAFTPEDELVGYACYGPTPGTDRTFDLYWIAVHPEAQGHGSGSILMTEVERRLQGQQARMLAVETSSRSEYAPTRGFYEARGYAEAARMREFYAPADDRIIFTKRFSSPIDGRGGGGALSR
ncbi:MAG: GNAT family N-acetyltransferase [Gemmatimonadaceae bacterium]